MAESTLFIRSFFFSVDTRIRPNDHQAQERTVHLLDHKVTVTAVFFSALLAVSFFS